MVNSNDILVKFRDLDISKQELISLLPKGSKVERAVVVSNTHLIDLLSKYKNNTINKECLLDWVNIVWFSDWFIYDEDQSDCIARIMSELEEIDEEGKDLNSIRLNEYINALENNLEL